MATMNISLPDAMKAWVDAQAKSGRYATASDYMQELIRRDQERTNKIAAMQARVAEGLDSGPAEPFDPAAFLGDMRNKHGAGRS